MCRPPAELPVVLPTAQPTALAMMHRLKRLTVIGVGLWTVLSLSGLTPASEPTINFARDVRPILSDYCYKCHGPDSEARKSDLRLDQREALTQEDRRPSSRGAWPT